MEFTVQQLEGKADGLEKLAAAGNIKETANLVASISLVLNVQTEEKGEEDLVKSKEVHTYPFSELKIFCSKMVATYVIHSIRKGKKKTHLTKRHIMRSVCRSKRSKFTSYFSQQKYPFSKPKRSRSIPYFRSMSKAYPISDANDEVKIHTLH